METNYAVRATVSGGVTGYRSSLCKDKDGRIMVFETREEASRKAAHCHSLIGRNSAATFHYSPEETDMPVNQERAA
jgi:hypothetical protein